MQATINLLLKTSGIVLVVLGIAMIPPLFVSIFLLDYHTAFAFTFSVATCIVLGYMLSTFSQNSYKTLHTRESIIVLTFSWLVACIVGGIPYLASNALSNPLDAFFESCSGFTTTGATIFFSVESLSPAILLWRSMTQWIGGVGIVVFALIVTPSLFIDGTGIAYNDMYRSAMPNSFKRVFKLVTTVVTVYFILTVLQLLLLCILGLDLFDASILSLGTISTGGFSNHDTGFLFFSKPSVKILVACFMVFCGLSANLVFNSYRKGKFIIRGNSENNLYWFVIISASLFITLRLLWQGEEGGLLSTIGNSVFQVISTVTTTGYATADYTMWPAFCVTILIMLMLVGGCSVSVSGGNKMIRAALLIKLVVHGIETRLHPNAITPIKLNRVDLPRDRISAVANHIFLFIFVLFSGAFIIAFDEMPIASCISMAISLISNTGLSFDMLSPGTISSAGEFSPSAKITSCLLMLAGRLELYNLLVIFTPSFWRSE